MLWLGHSRLKSEDPAERKAAVESMGHSGNSKAIEPLEHVLEDEDRHVREAAAVALGKIGDYEATRPLAAALTRKDYVAVQVKAAMSLGRVGDSGSLVALTAAFNKQVEHLPVQPDDPEDKILKGIFQVSQLDVREQDAEDTFLQIAAIIALAQTQNSRAARMLAESLAKEKSALIRYEIAGSLKRHAMPIEVRKLETELGLNLQEITSKAEDHLGDIGVYAAKAIESMLVEER